MKILQLTGYFLPEKAASIYLTENQLKAFGEAGFDTVIWTSRPTRGLSDEEYEEYKHKKTEKMYGGKVIVNRFAMYREGRNPILRALRYSLNWVVQLWKGIKEKDVSVIYLVSTPPIQGVLGVILKMVKKVPFVYNLQDIFPDSLVNNGLTQKDSLIWKIGRMVERITYKYADKIIVISEGFKENLLAKGVSEEKIVVVYNWVDQKVVVDIPREKNKLFDMYNLDREKFYITYNGNIGLSQNMDMLMEVAKALQSNSCIQFVLVGNGAYLDEVKKMVNERHLDNVRLLPFQPYEDISHVFSLGDVSLVISKQGTGSVSVPSKTWSIMSASRPVLANFDENELKEIINRYKCGIFTKAGDKVAFTDAILQLYHDRELCKRYGKNGRRFVMDNLTREVGTKKYVDVIRSVCVK